MEISPKTDLKVVLFPAPLEPTSPVMQPAGISMEQFNSKVP
jgi:hypothetical protein